MQKLFNYDLNYGTRTIPFFDHRHFLYKFQEFYFHFIMMLIIYSSLDSGWTKSTSGISPNNKAWQFSKDRYSISRQVQQISGRIKKYFNLNGNQVSIKNLVLLWLHTADIATSIKRKCNEQDETIVAIEARKIVIMIWCFLVRKNWWKTEWNSRLILLTWNE